jgi:hypothetical protein
MAGGPEALECGRAGATWQAQARGMERCNRRLLARAKRTFPASWGQERPRAYCAARFSRLVRAGAASRVRCRTPDTARSPRATARSAGGWQRGRSQAVQARAARCAVARAHRLASPPTLVRTLVPRGRRCSLPQGCYQQCNERYSAELITLLPFPWRPFHAAAARCTPC